MRDSTGGSRTVSNLSAELDRVFDDLVVPAETPPALASESPKAPGSQAPDTLERALHVFYGGQYARSLALLGELEEVRLAEPRARALKAVCTALVSGRVRPGIQVCLSIVMSWHIMQLAAFLV